MKGKPMGTLREEIEASNCKRGRKSKIDEILQSMSEEDAADLQAALDDHSVPQASIARALSRRGISIAQSVLSNYRTGLR
jgi:arginine repressor